MTDTFNTINTASEASLYKEKGSKFVGYAIPISSESEIDKSIQNIKAEHHKARHWCYAWRMGNEGEKYRVNDDGEPSNSAGQPIYGQILSKEITNVLVVVVRYFGGVKLGVGGLVRAYKTAAQLSIESSKIVTKTINSSFELSFEYKDMNKLQRIIKKYDVQIVAQELELSCKYHIRIRKSQVEQIIKAITDLRCIEISELDPAP